MNAKKTKREATNEGEGMARNYQKTKLQRVIIDSGEVEFEPNKGAPLSEIVEQAGRMLDALCLTNILLVQGSDGRYYLGEFAFELRPVSLKQAERMAREYAIELADSSQGGSASRT
jgi:hypothetical protein